MRCDASELWPGSCDRAARAAPLGGPAALPAPAPPTSATAPTTSATATTAPKLAKRSAGGLIEEMEVLRLDGDRDLVAELQVHVGWERCDEVRPRADDGLGGVALEHLLLLGDLALDVPSVDLEVGHRLAAERLDQLDGRPD